MEITINGKNIETEDNITLTQLLKKTGYDINFVAVAINKKIIDKAQFPTTILKEKDIVEILQFAGGG